MLAHKAETLKRDSACRVCRMPSQQRDRISIILANCRPLMNVRIPQRVKTIRCRALSSSRQTIISQGVPHYVCLTISTHNTYSNIPTQVITPHLQMYNHEHWQFTTSSDVRSKVFSIRYTRIL